MVVKFFSDKKGGGVGSLNYLLDKKRTQEGTARILAGDENLTRRLIRSMSQKHKTCVGCLSFEESNIDESVKRELMQSFENMLLTPAMQGRYNILWVEHTDKGRLELNFVIPKIDLESKKAFNPYFHPIDLKRIEIWQDLANLEHNFTNPKDPAKQNTLQGSKKQYELIKDYKALDELLHAQVMQGNIKSRDELISLLKAQNIEITRQGKDYLGIKLPDSQKAKRFKGGIYDEQFTSPRELDKILERTKERARAYNERSNTSEIERLRTELDSFIQSKARFYTSRNSKTSLQQHQAPNNQNLNVSNELSSRLIGDDDFKRDCVVSVDKTLSSLKGIHNNSQRRDLHHSANGSSHKNHEQHSDKNSLKEKENDSIRSRTYRRSGEITRRARECFNTARDHTAGKQRAFNRASELAEQLSKLRELIQQQFKSLANRIREALEHKKKQQKSRRFSR